MCVAKSCIKSPLICLNLRKYLFTSQVKYHNASLITKLNITQSFTEFTFNILS